MNMRELLARRAKLAAEMRELADQADATTGVLTPEQQAAFDAIKTAFVSLENAITNRAAVDDAERRSSVPTDSRAPLPGRA